MATLARGIDLSIPPERWMDEWAKRGPAIAKANLIANEHTLESLTRFNANLASKAAVLNALRPRTTAVSLHYCSNGILRGPPSSRSALKRGNSNSASTSSKETMREPNTAGSVPKSLKDTSNSRPRSRVRSRS